MTNDHPTPQHPEFPVTPAGAPAAPATPPTEPASAQPAVATQPADATEPVDPALLPPSTAQPTTVFPRLDDPVLPVAPTTVIPEWAEQGGAPASHPGERAQPGEQPATWEQPSTWEQPATAGVAPPPRAGTAAPAGPARDPWATPTNEPRRPLTGTIIWGCLILAFCGFIAQRVLAPGTIQPAVWVTAVVLFLGVALVGAGIAAIVRQTRSR